MSIKILIKKYNDLRNTNDTFAFFTAALPILLSGLIVLVICH